MTWSSLCFLTTLLVGASYQRATVLTTSDTNDYSDTVGLQVFADHVDRWKNISYIEEPIGSSGLSTDDRTKDCPPCSCGESSSSLGIIDGNFTSVKKYPWMAYVQVNIEGETLICGGSLINSKYIMTAAHCVFGRNRQKLEPKDVTVQLLRYDWFFYSEFKVMQLIVHENYKPASVEDDIALLRLDTDLDIGQESKYHSVCLPPAGENFDGYNGIVTGWGETTEKGKLSYLLREVVVPIISNDKCRSYDIGHIITDTMLCAGYNQGGKDSCGGDSGGPLLTNDDDEIYVVVGIVSWGRGCARPQSPGVYTRVNSYLDWLAVNTKDACWCNEH